MFCKKNKVGMGRTLQPRGFTLVELMIVVVILGILAAVAIAGYGAYIKKSRNAEATAMLADIRLKQEAYRGTFHQYADLSGACSMWIPRGSPNGDAATTTTWDATCQAGWRQLGVLPPNGLYFIYYSEAGVPGATPGRTEYTSNGVNSATDFWFGATALQDLDEDGDCGGFVTVSGVLNILDLSEGSISCP